MQNLEGARLICESIGVDKEMFFNAIITFGGASKRLELVAANQTCSVFKDFAHSPSKLKATIQAVKEQFPERHLIACMELHTYSSLNINFLEEYKHTMDLAGTAVIYYSNHALELKRLSLLSVDDVSKAFGKNDLLVFNDIEILEKFLLSQTWKNTNLLMMSSGNFENLNLKQLSENILS